MADYFGDLSLSTDPSLMANPDLATTPDTPAPDNETGNDPSSNPWWQSGASLIADIGKAGAKIITTVQEVKAAVAQPGGAAAQPGGGGKGSKSNTGTILIIGVVAVLAFMFIFRKQRK